MSEARIVGGVFDGEVVKTQCPRCGDWINDLDGFGVLAHIEPVEGACGYCSHPSRYGDVCDICGDVDPLGGAE